MTKCPYCNSSQKTWCKGWRYNKSGKKQMWWCNSCKRRFTIDEGFWKMKHKPEIIAEACNNHKRGMSLKNIKDHLGEYRKTYIKTYISRVCVLNWIHKYSKLLVKHTENFTPKIKGPLHND
jgi:transposase-like protein